MHIEAGKQMIDILGIRQEKTKGNLSAEEDQLLENILYELRMLYLEETKSIKHGPFELGGLGIVPLPLLHARLPVLGFRIGDFASLTDVSSIPEPTWQPLEGLQVLVLGALRDDPHPAHFTVAEAIERERKIGARLAWFTHICHDLDHDTVNARLPDGIPLGYDGLPFEL